MKLLSIVVGMGVTVAGATLISGRMPDAPTIPNFVLITEFLPIDISGLDEAMERIPEMKSPAEMCS